VGRRIDGVLFDAGGVLIGPVGGRWNPRYDFESVVLAHHPMVNVERFGEAIGEGQLFLDAGVPTAAGSATVNRSDYHRAMLRVLGIAEPSRALLHELEAPPAEPAVEIFADVRPVLDRLTALGVRMSVVSDTWAGLDVSFQQVGIGHYFEGFVMSEVLGCRKPDPRMYAAGSDLLSLRPSQCLFVDNDPALVEAAIGLGYHGVVIDRHGRVDTALPAITSLHELMPIVAETW
jgi:HAD superfamily hydrolase (TIGR01509 family)